MTTDILDRGLGTAGVLYYAALRSPRLIDQVAPIAALAGGLFALLAAGPRGGAIIAMRVEIGSQSPAKRLRPFGEEAGGMPQRLAGELALAAAGGIHHRRDVIRRRRRGALSSRVSRISRS